MNKNKIIDKKKIHRKKIREKKKKSLAVLKKLKKFVEINKNFEKNCVK